MASRRIEDLHPKLQPIAKEFLKRADEILGGYQAFITDGYRSMDEQTKKYAQGRTIPGNIVTNAQAGQSPHNFGLAFDIAFRKDGSKEAKWDRQLYEKLADLSIQLGLEWGGSWTGFVDNPHYQLPNWVSIKNKQKSEKENIMPETNIYMGLDLSNPESMKVAIKAWKDIVDGKYVEREDYDNDIKAIIDKSNKKVDIKLVAADRNNRKRLAEVLKVGEGETFEDMIYMIKELKSQPESEQAVTGDIPLEVPEPHNEISQKPSIKFWYQSKTIWFNIIMSIIGIAAFVVSMGSELPGVVSLIAVMIQGGGNVLLRIWFTNTALGH